LRGLTHEELQVPLFAPDVAFEILSPGDRRADVDDKIGVLLRSGTALVVVVDSQPRLVELHDVSGMAVLDADCVLEHPALPGFRYPLAELFAELDLPR
jgi:Uma2 family endonuclease